MAKKTSGARGSKKTTTKKRASTTKKVTKKAPAKKKAAAKKSAAKKKVTKKKPAAKKPVAKKSTTKKAASKKVTKKKTVKKPVSKKTTTKKTTKKSATTKKASAKKTGKKTPAKKAAAPSNGAATRRRTFSGQTPEALKAGQDAAARLAAAAGLSPMSSSQHAAESKKSRYKKLTKSPLSAEQLAEFRQILITKRNLIVGDVSSMEKEALGSGGSGALSSLPQHMADQGSDTFDQSLNLDLAAAQRKLLKEIDDALERIENNTFGICEMLGKAIKIERLRNAPWSRYSIDAARMSENPGYLPS